MTNFWIMERVWWYTRDLPIFSINDVREYGLIKYFEKQNQIGAFFKWMSDKGYTKSNGEPIRVKHKAGNKRWVFQWVWTDKMEEYLRE